MKDLIKLFDHAPSAKEVVEVLLALKPTVRVYFLEEPPARDGDSPTVRVVWLDNDTICFVSKGV